MSAPSTHASLSTASTSSAGGKPDRLYVGNLAPTVDEYTLIQVFQKYGRITKLDFMFHKTGALKGKPRGYAFVEFSNKDDALKAMVKLHDRLLRGRKLVVTYASSAPPSDLPLPLKGRRSAEAPKTTTLSLLKSRQRPTTAAAQIAAMEAKLASMAKRKPEDEDYVPGQTITGLASGSASPAPPGEDEPDLDESFIGAAEAEQAADDLEREMMAELDIPGTPGASLSPAPPSTADEQPSKRRRVASPDSVAQHNLKTLEKPLGNSLPPRPGGPLPTPSANSPQKGDPPAVLPAPNSAFQRGLAGLPRKPAF